jgi:chromosome segregation ATPase
MIPRHAHKRSLSSEHRALSPEKTVTKAKSTTNLTEITSQANADSNFHPKFEESSFSTLQDPRLAVGSEVSPSTSSTHHPDLSNEVAALSVKLIQAINNQTTLDDNLVATRQELESAQGKIKALESQNEKYRRDIDEQVFIKKSDSDREIMQLKAALAEEKAARAVVEKGKKTIEQELETLTADLFEEANKVSPFFCISQSIAGSGLTLVLDGGCS